MGKIFGTDGIRCLVNEEPLSAETTLKISKTVGYLLKSNHKKNSRVIICKDTRLSGYMYEPLITAGFISMGMEVILVGPLPTPAVPHLMNTLRADIGVMITALYRTQIDQGIVDRFGESDLVGIPSMMILAFVLSLCSTSDAFIAAQMLSFSSAAKLSFLIFGPMMDVKLVFMYGAVFKPKFVILMALSLFVAIAVICSVWGNLPVPGT